MHFVVQYKLATMFSCFKVQVILNEMLNGPILTKVSKIKNALLAIKAIYPEPLACDGNFNICPQHVNTVKHGLYISERIIWNEPHCCSKQCD